MSPVPQRVALWLGLLLAAPGLLPGLEVAEPVVLRYCDLAALVAASDQIVLAERQAGGPTQSGAMVRYRVKRAYQGLHLPGREIAISEADYDLQGGALDARDGQPPQPLDGEAVLFLGRPDRPGPEREFHPIGCLVISRGKVYRLDRLRATSARLEPFPQGREGALYEPFEEPEKVAPVSLAEFETDLHDAIARREALAAAGMRRDPAERRARLLALLPPPGAPPPRFVLEKRLKAHLEEPRELDFTFEDIVLSQLSGEGDMELRFEGGARVTSALGDKWLAPLAGEYSSGQLLAVLLAKHAPPYRREGALQLAAMVTEPRKEIADAVLVCLGDEVRSVRCAAAKSAAVLARAADRRESLRTGLLAAWKRETDPWAQLAILGALQKTGVSEPLGDADQPVRLIAAARFHPPFAEVGCGRPDGGEAIPREVVCVAVSMQTGLERRSQPVRFARELREPPRETRWLRLRFDPPLAPGRHTMWLELRVESAGRTRSVQTTPEEVPWR